MKKKYLILIIFFFALLFQDICEAQTTIWKRKRKEFFFGAGATNFLGDLGGANQIGTNGLKDFDFPAIRTDFIVGYRYRTSRSSSVKVNLIYARLAGNDKYTKEPYRSNRNCNFKTPVVELNTQFEYFIGRERQGHIYNLKKIKGWSYIQISTYVFAGVGVIYFNPKGKYLNNKWYTLKPLCTEGEGLVTTRKEYSLLQLVIPFGVGFKFALNSDWSVGIEYGVRKTFTDYIDDVSKTYFDPYYLTQEKGELAKYFANPTNNSLPSFVTAPGQQRGDPTDKDSYMFAFISFYYKIPKGSSTLPKYK